MKVSEVGEFGLIDLLSDMVSFARKPEQASLINLDTGIGDDAAVWRSESGLEMATTDLLIEGVHFTTALTSYEELGWRAMAANLSDIAAMGGLPRYALVSVALPGDTEVDDVKAFYRGMLELANRFGTAIVGGDVSSASQMVINIAVFGVTSENKIMKRSAAVPGDVIAVTGYLGGSAGGLEILSGKNKAKGSAAGLKEAFLKPFPRVAEGRIMAGKGVKAAIDISDGLVADLGHICRMSGTGAKIDTTAVPVHPELDDNFGERTLTMALTGGEDYELLFTAPAAIVETVKNAVSCPVTVIGEVTDNKKGEIRLLDGIGHSIVLPVKGWDHFKR